MKTAQPAVCAETSAGRHGCRLIENAGFHVFQKGIFQYRDPEVELVANKHPGTQFNFPGLLSRCRREALPTARVLTPFEE